MANKPGEIPVATAVSAAPSSGAPVQGTAQPVAPTRATEVAVLPGQAMGIVVVTQYTDQELVELAGRVLQIASTICCMSVFFEIIVVVVTAATTSNGTVIGNTIIQAIFSILIAMLLFRIAYLGVVTKNAQHGCAPCCPCCPGLLEFYRGIAFIGMAFHIITAIMTAIVGIWVSFVLSLILASIFYRAVVRCNAFLVYIRANPNSGGLAAAVEHADQNA